MSLRLRDAETRAMEAHLARAYPEEGCGVLLGRDAGDARIVERVLALENHSADARERRFLIAPEQFLAAERSAREAGLEVLGFYHSHPDHPARPSAFDLDHAWPYYSYLIVSLEKGRVVESRSWRLAADRSRFEPESLEPVAAVPRVAGAPGRETTS